MKLKRLYITIFLTMQTSFPYIAAITISTGGLNLGLSVDLCKSEAGEDFVNKDCQVSIIIKNT